ncbi:arylsulfatase [Fodinibius roseus]|uniref:Arylsulfatase n=1 Tax=Fodinibius roseus TaxID=1194090 RepID=A0A1M4UN87_9BACT|nr:arylsulfatase [Fodinibius roseus]SHE58043.1 arylsulfatase [Fodinibius roseus]
MINIRIALSILLCVLAGCAATEPEEAEQPNIIYILADDLGYGDIGAYGQEKIETPNIDALAQNGMTFIRHYSGAPVCAPARYMLMTGRHPGHAYIRGNDEWVARGDVWNYEKMAANPALEGQRPIPDSTITIAEVLQQAGYKTAAIGKWGLGAPFTEGVPNNQGFDFFFGYNGQRQAHSYYPIYLWRNNQRVALSNELVPPHQGLPEGADPYDSESYARFHEQPDYAPELMGREALRFIEANRDTSFFLYFATNIPHVSLQAPRRWIEHYREKFGDEEPYVSEDRGGRVQYTPARYPNATYAAMISYLDEQVGQLVAKLKELGEYENTLIIFTSDNGPLNGLGVSPEYFDSAGPFSNQNGRVKGSVHEGGIRVPMIASWPAQIEAGSTSDHLSAFWDIMPTLSEVAGTEPPGHIDGISFLPVLQGNEEDQPRHDYLYWEFPASSGQQAVRMGRWKGIRQNIMSEDNLDIELYDLEEDTREERNVAGQHPEVVDSIRTIMEREHTVPDIEHFRMEALAD